ncbi:DNA-directed RNA polymerase subunit alpha [Candidatus Hepatobacter penaei]|jgi:DNA-directed RNA polymerase subunit alpha|uniref:DNA-directed RNA polymerase subunit alpha n=1 Tax=Candidatus Hepatobacter penaei TaxID=1274402 RepID=UPI0006965FFE|nr:DNA-directed RNA polymerase subunit alpha [Candidatus Hepatobacter penaei]TGW15911.1 DNA-directed RNA polymerase subunit alpha [bacterium NHP-B]
MLRQNWQQMIKPCKVKVSRESDQGRHANLTFEPFEEGLGITIGTALRRILLSSLRGAAVTAVRFSNVLHEFSSIPGVQEDVTNILLNLKNLDIKYEGSGPCQVRVQAEGPKTLTAGMIDGGGNVDFLSPDQPICVLGKDAKVDFELTIETGKGYSSVGDRSKEDLALGTILVDAIFNPVKRCSFVVESTHVAQFNCDRLVLTVETNGSISPEDAVSAASRILQEQLGKFIHFKDIEEPYVEEVETTTPPLSFNADLLRKVEELDLSLRSSNCLKAAKIVYIGDLVLKSESELLRTPNFGRKSLSEISDVLKKMDLRLGMSVADWPPEDMDEALKKSKEALSTRGMIPLSRG